MEYYFERFTQPSFMIPFCIFALPVIVWGITSVIGSTGKARVAEAEVQLKRELVAQGRSAEEIERIMNSQSSREKLNA